MLAYDKDKDVNAFVEHHVRREYPNVAEAELVDPYRHRRQDEEQRTKRDAMS